MVAVRMRDSIAANSGNILTDQGVARGKLCESRLPLNWI